MSGWMTKDEKIAELRNDLTISRYQAHFLQQRLDAIRKVREQLISLIDTQTLQEHIEAGSEVSTWPGLGRGLG